MNKQIRILFQASLTVLILLGGKTLFAQDSILKNLPGVWISQNDPSRMEIWDEDSTGLIGRSVKLKDNGEEVLWESLRIFRRKDTLVYEADVVGNNKPVEFTLLVFLETELVFTNTKHDFPKVIHYKLIDANHLKAEVYGDSYAERLIFNFYRKPTSPRYHIYPEGE